MQEGDRLLQRDRLRGAELGVEPAGLDLLHRCIFQQRPAADVLIAELHALLPVGAMRARGHAPFRRAVLVHDRQIGLARALR